MGDLRLGEVLHGVKAADWGCCRVEFVAHDWAVARTEHGNPVFIPASNRNEVGPSWHDHGVECPFAPDEEGDDRG